MRCDGRDNRKKLCDFVFIVGGGEGGGGGGGGGGGEGGGCDTAFSNGENTW